MPYYWAARLPTPVEPGFRVPGWDPSRGGPDVMRVEAIFEEVRKQEAPSRPSRLGAKYVCRKQEGFCSTSNWRAEGGVYQVDVKGKKFIANPEAYTEARIAARDGDWERVREWASQYWREGMSYPFSEEIVVDGTVTVLRRVDMPKSGGIPPIDPEPTRGITLSTTSEKRVAAAYLRRTGSIRTAGEVRFIKDRGGDKNEWAWGTPGPMQREIGEFQFRQSLLKPLSACLRSTLMAMGHALSASNTFAKIKSADVSPDGALGGKGYIQKIADIRRAYMNVVEALSAVSDTLYDEIKAPHWHPEAVDGGARERESVQDILQDVEQVRSDPEGWAEDEAENANLGESPTDDELEADELDPSVSIQASSRTKMAAIRVASMYTAGVRR